MNTDSIDKLLIIDENFIQIDCKSPYLTSNTNSDYLPNKLTAKSRSGLFVTSGNDHISTSGDIYYKPTTNGAWASFSTSVGTLVNPIFTSGSAIYTNSAGVVPGWPANTPTTGWAIASSSNYSTIQNAFDTDAANTWSSTVNYVATGEVASSPPSPSEQWISIKYPFPVIIKEIEITRDSASASASESAPKLIIIYGSTDNLVWTNINNVIYDVSYDINNKWTTTLSGVTPYQYFKFEFLRTYGGTSVIIKNIRIQTMSMSTDGTATSYYNPMFTNYNTVTTTDWEASTYWLVSSSSNGDSAFHVFDANLTNTWSSTVNYVANTGVVASSPPAPSAQWIGIRYPIPVKLKSIAITIDTTLPSPKTLRIEGGTLSEYVSFSWITIYETPSGINETYDADNICTIDLTSNNADYNVFKVTFLKTNGGTSVTIKNIVFSTYTLPGTLTDINFTNRLQRSSILSILNNLRICYNLLDSPAQLSNYKAGRDVTIKKYSMSSERIYDDVTDASDISAAITTIFSNPSKLDPAKTNFYALKRLLKAYEYIIHVYIAMALETGEQTPITDLILKSLNQENIAVNDSNNGYTQYQTNITNATTKYNSRLDTIDNLDIQLEDLKEKVVKEKTEKTTNSNILNKNTVVYYVFLLLFIVLVCILLYALQNKEDDKSKMYVGGVLATSIVAMIIIYFINMTYLKEGFITESDAQFQLNSLIEKHLTDTINIGLMVDKSTLYSGDLLHVVNKEIDRYDVVNKQLKLEAVGTNDVQVYDYRSARVLQYRVYLLLQIITILSVAMFIYLYTGENVLLFGISLLLILFMIYLYIMNTHGMVHTDAKKIYWGQPSII